MPASKKSKARPSDAESVSRKKSIIQRQAAGEPVAAIAKDLGVSRAYAYYILKEHKERGDSVVARQGRGKPKDTPLTKKQSQALLAAIKGSKPYEHGIDSGMWSEPEVKEWFLNNFKRTISVGQIRKLSVDQNIRMRPLSAEEWKQIPSIPTNDNEGDEETQKESDSSEALSTSEDWLLEEDFDIEAIKESVKATRESLAKKQYSSGPPQPGVRTGKHRKQRAPQQKKKKRKK
ncbi:MAG: helix-turn-helix domain-containing protein [Opitutales bacterium]